MPNIDYRTVPELLDDVRATDIMPPTPDLYAAVKSEVPPSAGERSATLQWLTNRAQGIVAGVIE